MKLLVHKGRHCAVVIVGIIASSLMFFSFNIDHLYGLGGNLRALMQVNELDSAIESTDFEAYVQQYLTVTEEQLVTKYKIPKDRVDIIPEALNLYQLIINELQSKRIENSFWSISDGLVKKIVKGQL